MEFYDLSKLRTDDDFRRINLQMRNRSVALLRQLLGSRKLQLKLFVRRLEILEAEGYDLTDEDSIFATLRAHRAELASYRQEIKKLIQLIRDLDREIYGTGESQPRH